VHSHIRKTARGTLNNITHSRDLECFQYEPNSDVIHNTLCYKSCTKSTLKPEYGHSNLVDPEWHGGDRLKSLHSYGKLSNMEKPLLRRNTAVTTQ
jgi:hypothetical protein